MAEDGRKGSDTTQGYLLRWPGGTPVLFLNMGIQGLSDKFTFERGGYLRGSEDEEEEQGYPRKYPSCLRSHQVKITPGWR